MEKYPIMKRLSRATPTRSIIRRLESPLSSATIVAGLSTLWYCPTSVLRIVRVTIPMDIKNPTKTNTVNIPNLFEWLEEVLMSIHLLEAKSNRLQDLDVFFDSSAETQISDSYGIWSGPL